MTMHPDPMAPGMVPPSTTRVADIQSYVDWPAILAGAALAYGLFLVLATFGAGIGLSMVSPEPGEGASLLWYTIASGVWFIWITISSFAAGGYLAGRMRRRVGDATEDEVETRDGAHGVVVWAVGALVATIMAATGVTNIIGTAASGVGGAASTVADTMEEPMDYFAGVALRSDAGTVASDPEVRDEIASVMTRAFQEGELTEEDRTYLASVIADATGATQEDARAQLDAAVLRAQEAWDEAIETADQMRIAGAIAAFVLAATMLAGAAAAYFAATSGGEHRDRSVGFRTLRH